MNKATLIRIATFLGGIYFFVEYLLPESVLESWGADQLYIPLSQGFTLLAVMAIGLGVINLLAVHGRKIVFSGEGRMNSAALLAGLIVTFFATLNIWLQGLEISSQTRPFSMLGLFAERIASDALAGKSDVPPLVERLNAMLVEGRKQAQTVDSVLVSSEVKGTVGEGFVSEARNAVDKFHKDLEALDRVRGSNDATEMLLPLKDLEVSAPAVGVTFRTVLLKSAELSFAQKLYLFVFDGLLSPLGSAMFALLGVYIASAAYRAFRIRSLESGLMMGAAVIVILGQIPLGLLVSENMPQVRQWLLEIPNSAAFRAIRLGAGVGGLLLAVRMWLSLESSSLERRKG